MQMWQVLRLPEAYVIIFIDRAFNEVHHPSIIISTTSGVSPGSLTQRQQYRCSIKELFSETFGIMHYFSISRGGSSALEGRQADAQAALTRPRARPWSTARPLSSRLRLLPLRAPTKCPYIHTVCKKTCTQGCSYVQKWAAVCDRENQLYMHYLDTWLIRVNKINNDKCRHKSRC